MVSDASHKYLTFSLKLNIQIKLILYLKSTVIKFFVTNLMSVNLSRVWILRV